MKQPYRLSCHRKAICLEADAPLEDLVRCNCSTCRRFGAIHWYVSSESVQMLDECRSMTNYIWREINEGHCFCTTCGTSIMRTGYPDGVVALNACCVEKVDIFALDIKEYDGREKMPPGILL